MDVYTTFKTQGFSHCTLFIQLALMLSTGEEGKKTFFHISVYMR